jgi:Tfp pilus assembly protein FimT
MPRRSDPAFSLLELVLVLFVVSVALAAVTPSLGGWSRGMKLRNAAEEIRAATLATRERAVRSAVAAELVLDAAAGVGWIHGGTIAAEASASNAPGTPATVVFALPSGLSLTATDGTGRAIDRIVFHPNGRATVATIVVADERGGSIRIVGETPGSGFLIHTGGGPR